MRSYLLDCQVLKKTVIGFKRHFKWNTIKPEFIYWKWAKLRILVCSGCYNKIPLTWVAYENFISHNLKPGSLGSGCQLARFWVEKSFTQFMFYSYIILISHPPNCINVKEYYKSSHFFSTVFIVALIFTCPCVPQWKGICWYFVNSYIFNYSMSFYFKWYLAIQYCPGFCFSSQSEKDLVWFLFLFLWPLYFKNMSFSFFCPCNDNQFHLYHSTHSFLNPVWSQ